MKRNALVASLLAWFLLSDPPAAYANNPPAPDGMLSIILLFPVVIVGFIFAGARLNDKEKKWLPVRMIVLGISALLTAAGTALAIIPLLILLWYGVRRGAQAMARGQGLKRFAIGCGVILFTLFAVANYLASTNNWPSESQYAAPGAEGVRNIVAAEMGFRSEGKLDANKNGVPEYGSLQQLYQAGLIEAGSLSATGRSDYRFTVVLTGDPARDEKEFFVYATPVHYGSSRRTLSLLDAFRPHSARTTFAADESGVIRRADLGGSRDVTRQETLNWEKLIY
ncbi:MAG: hypothetical protein LAP13_23080 [Acidobacteriia bacterium]|nr:hypothetical protein [Terriglobia bacterium]